MQVSHLSDYLLALEGPLRQTGGAKAATDLRKTAEALHPFALMKVEELANFLEIAWQYHKTGVIPAGKTSRKPAKSTTVDQAKVEAAAQTFLNLYERSIDEGIEYSGLEKELKALEKSVSAAEAKELARLVDLPKSLAAKGKIFAALKQKLFERKESFQRASF